MSLKKKKMLKEIKKNSLSKPQNNPGPHLNHPDPGFVSKCLGSALQISGSGNQIFLHRHQSNPSQHQHVRNPHQNDGILPY